jgi:membrane associated rhomboid family serine protease
MIGKETMTHEEKVAYLLRDLGQKGVGQYTIAPPIYRLLWRLGIEIRPPHFASFWSLAAPMAVGFGIFWGIFMWLTVWQQGSSVSLAVGTAASAGLFFGVFMAAYYRWRARKLALPRWEDYPTS